MERQRRYRATAKGKAARLEQGRRQTEKRRAWLQALKSDQPCEDCGGVYPHYVMDWHHIDPATKSFAVGNAINAYSEACVLEEVSKCLLLCANCHREREHGGG